MSTRTSLRRDEPLITQLYIDGRWCDSEVGGRLPVVNPSTEEVITEVQAGSAADVERAVNAATRALRDWKNTTGAARAAYLRAMTAA